MSRWSLRSENGALESGIGESVPTTGTDVGIQRRPRPLRYARKLSKLKGSEWLLLLQMSTLLCSFLRMHRKLSMRVLMETFDAEPDPPGTWRVRPGRLTYLATGLVRFTLRDRYCIKRSVSHLLFLTQMGALSSRLLGCRQGG